MPTLAGQMRNTAPTNPQWVACNGQWINVLGKPDVTRTKIPNTPSTGDRRDYTRRVGRFGGQQGLGQQGWRFRVPTGTGWWISTADDNTETTLTAPIYTPQNLPAGVK